MLSEVIFVFDEFHFQPFVTGCWHQCVKHWAASIVSVVSTDKKSSNVANIEKHEKKITNGDHLHQCLVHYAAKWDSVNSLGTSGLLLPQPCYVPATRTAVFGGNTMLQDCELKHVKTVETYQTISDMGQHGYIPFLPGSHWLNLQWTTVIC